RVERLARSPDAREAIVQVQRDAAREAHLEPGSRVAPDLEVALAGGKAAGGELGSLGYEAADERIVERRGSRELQALVALGILARDDHDEIHARVEVRPQPHVV